MQFVRGQSYAGAFLAASKTNETINLEVNYNIENNLTVRQKIRAGDRK